MTAVVFPVQPDDAVQAAHFDLNNWAHWKAMDDAAIAYLTSSPPERMERTLDELDRIWGSPEAYLHSIGIDEAVVGRLRETLLED